MTPDWNDLMKMPASEAKKVFETPTQNDSWIENWKDSLKNRMRMNNDALLRNEIPWIEEFIKQIIAKEREEAYQKGLEDTM